MIEVIRSNKPLLEMLILDAPGRESNFTSEDEVVGVGVEECDVITLISCHSWDMQARTAYTSTSFQSEQVANHLRGMKQ